MNDDRTEPPPPPAEPGEAKKATGGLRALSVLLVFVVLFGAAVIVLVMVDLGDAELCSEVGADGLSFGEECYAGSSTEKTIGLVAGWPAAALLALGALGWLGVAVMGRSVRFALACTLAGALLFGVALAIA